MSEENKASDFFPIAELLDEIVLMVLKLLPVGDVLSAVCGVSRRLRRLGLDSITELDVGNIFAGTSWSSSSSRSPPSVTLLKSIMDRCPRIRTVRLDHYTSPPWDRSVELSVHALRSCPRLVELRNVSMASPAFYDALGTHGLSMRRLQLYCIGSSSSLSLDKMRQLTHIELIGHWLLPGENKEFLRQLLEIGECCKNLESFTLRCYNRELEGWEEMATFLRSIRDTIKELCLTERLMDDDSFSALVSCYGLEKLEFHRAVEMSLFRLRCILRLPRLAELCIKRSTTNTMADEENYIRAFSEGTWKRLKRLDLRAGHFLGDAVLLTIAQACPELISLTVDFSRFDGSKRVPSEAVSSDGLRRSVLTHCRKLRELTLEGAWNLPLAAFADVQERLPLLRRLRVPDLLYCSFPGRPC